MFGALIFPALARLLRRRIKCWRAEKIPATGFLTKKNVSILIFTRDAVLVLGPYWPRKIQAVISFAIAIVAEPADDACHWASRSRFSWEDATCPIQ